MNKFDRFTEYNLTAAYYRDIGKCNFLTADEELTHSRTIQQNFHAIINCIGERSLSFEPLNDLREKINIWKKRDKSLKPKHHILSGIRKGLSELGSNHNGDDDLKELQSIIENHLAAIRTAKDIMIQANLPLVVATAKRFKTRGLSLSDLIQEGNVGLMRAVVRFDYKKGLRFATYATWWIKQAISTAISNTGKEIRQPYHFRETCRKFYKAFQLQKKELGRKPTMQELSRITKIPMKQIRLIIESSAEPVSLETPVGEDGTPMSQFIENKKAESPYQQTLLKEMFHELHQSLTALTERQRDVVCLRFGLSGQGECTLQEIGDKFKVTRECIRQTEVRALRQLRKSSNGDEIRNYCMN